MIPRTVSELASMLFIPAQSITFCAMQMGGKNTKSLGKYKGLIQSFRIKKSTGKYRLVFKFRGIVKKVLVAVSRLIQRTIPVSEHSLAYEKGRCVKAASTVLSSHKLICAADFKDHFGSILRVQVQSMFESHGYLPYMAWLMSRLCCVCHNSRDFLPQGSPISPFVANRVSEFLVDKPVLDAFPDAKYYRYSDNIYLCFDDKSVNGKQTLDKLKHVIGSVVKWRMHKFKVMPYYRSQKALGLVLNYTGRMPRHEYDRLKAVLYNSVKDLPEARIQANRLGFLDTDTDAEFVLKLGCIVSYWKQFVTETQALKLTTLVEAINEKANTSNC